MKRDRFTYSFLLLVGDFLAIVAAFVLAYIFRVTIDARPLIEQIPAKTYLAIFLTLLPFWLLIFASLSLYRKEVYEKRFAELWRLAVGAFAGMLFIIGYDFISGPESTIFPARLVAVYGFLLGFALLVLIRQILWQFKKLGYKYGIGVNRVMIVGDAPATKQLVSLLGDTSTSGHRIASIVGPATQVPNGFDGKHYSSLNDALRYATPRYIDSIIQTQWYESPDRNNKIQQTALKNHLEYKLMLAESQFASGSVKVELFNYFPVIAVHPTSLLGWGRIGKRIFDLILGFIFTLLSSPLLLLIALAIKISDPGPIIFKQKRLTRGGKLVNVYKFRTMIQKYSGKSPESVFSELNRQDLLKEFYENRGKVENDPRISRLGSFLRHYSLDEFPQLFNVLKGEISLVGPRTILKTEAEQAFREKTPLLLSVKTGITGLAQVSGRSDISMEERIRLDLYYVQNWSFWLDLKILFKTVGVVLSSSGSK